MKTRRMKIYSGALAGIAAFTCAAATFSFTACKKTEDTKEEAGTFLINDFEKETDMYQLIPSGGFGKIEYNTNKEYVLTGEASARVEANVTASAERSVKHRLISKRRDYNFADISRAEKLTAQIYNAHDEDITLAVAIEFYNQVTTQRNKVTLKAGEWNAVTYKVFPEILALQYDTQKAMYLDYFFEKKDMEKSPVLYFDNITISMSAEQSEPIEMTFDKDEFCSFDKNYQSFVPYISGWGSYITDVTETGLTANPDYTAGGKGCAFKAHTIKGSQRWRNWYYLYFSENFCAAAGLNKVSENDKLTFSVYNDGPDDSLAILLFVKVETEKTSTKLYVDITTRKEKYPGIVNNNSMPSGKWTQMTIDFKIVQQSLRDLVQEKYGVENYDVLGNLVRFGVAWGEFIDCAEKDFYFDDFRFIRGGSEQ